MLWATSYLGARDAWLVVSADTLDAECRDKMANYNFMHGDETRMWVELPEKQVTLKMRGQEPCTTFLLILMLIYYRIMLYNAQKTEMTETVI